MNTKEFNEIAAAYAAVYSEAEQLDENRMASRMGKMPSAPAKVGKATHSIKDLTPSKEPSPKEKAKARKALGLDEASVTDDRVRRNQKTFGSNYTPPRDWDQSANRGQGAVLNAKQKEKQRRKSLRKEEVDVFDVIVEHLLSEGYADTAESATAILANMSEDWRESIVEQIVYGGVKTTDTPADSKPKTMVVTAADKAGNTKAYQNFKAGDPRYSAASHLKGV